MEATLSAADATLVQVGQSAELQIEGSPKTVVAKVARINPSAQAGSRSVLAYLNIVNTGGANGKALPLRQGLFAQGTLGTSRASMLAVPLGSVRTDKPAAYVQAIENGRIVHKPVEVGARGTAGPVDVVAIQGAADGTLVILGNIGSLREGTEVRFTRMGVPSMASAASSKSAP